MSRFFAASIFLFLLVPEVKSQNDFKKEAQLLIHTFQKKHYCPREINNQFSEKVFSKILDNLDPDRLLFTYEDIDKLSIYKSALDEELYGKAWFFLPKLTELYKQKLQKSEAIFTALLDKPFSFKEQEYYNAQDTTFAKDDAELTKRWRLYLKYTLLWHLAFNGDSAKASMETKIVSQESILRNKIKSIEKRNVDKILNHPGGFETYVANSYFSIIAQEFDPHSNYFSKTEWQNFEGLISPDEYSFGFEVSENELGDLIIERLIPGGPAWKSNEIHKGDILISLKWHTKDKIDLFGADVRDVYTILNSSNNEKLQVTVKKANGELKTITLLKEKLVEEDNIVKSFILKGDKKIGYISLPGFYSDNEIEKNHYSGCSNDVAKELVKLQKENIDGLILDIRYNGGGALMEGWNMAGIFINEGPLFMTKNKNEKPTVMKDLNRGTVYDGPLVVMVNGQTASASELLASTLQDYNRALIVGTHTYGKATGQVIFPLDSNLTFHSQEKEILKSPFGLAAVTITKLYRVDGSTAQLCGVKPDVILPDVYENYYMKEKTFDNPIPADSANKKAFYQPLSPLPKKVICEKSQTRVNNNADFKTIEKISNEFDKFKTIQYSIPLSPKAFTDYSEKMTSWWNDLKKQKNNTSGSFEIIPTSYEKELMQIDTFKKEVNEAVINNLSKDLYIEECYSIVSDLIELTK